MTHTYILYYVFKCFDYINTTIVSELNSEQCFFVKFYCQLRKKKKR